MKFRKLGMVLIWLFALALLHPANAQACSACFGQSDSPLAEGMNWGILSLMAIVASVLGGFVALFAYFAWRAKRMPVTSGVPAVLGRNF